MKSYWKFICLSGLWVATAWGEPAKRFVVTDYGAKGDGQTLNTTAIQSTIERCEKEGGGVVVIPAGTFISGSIFLRQGVNFCLEQGGVLKGSQDTNDYP